MAPTSTNPPPALQRLADAAVNGSHYRTTDALWAYLCKAHASFAEKITRQGPRGNAPDGMVETLKQCFKSMKQAKKRGTFKPPAVDKEHAAPTATKNVQKKLPPKLTELHSAGAEQMLWRSTDEGMIPAEKFDIDDLDAESVGYSITDPSVAVRAMDHFYDETPFVNACAVICKKAQLHILNAKRNRPLRERYHIEEITLYFATKSGAPMPFECFLIQFGQDRHVQFQDRTETVKAKGILAESVRLSVQLSNFDMATDFAANVKSSFAKAAMTAVGPTNLYKEEKPFYTTTVSASWRKGMVDRHLGFTCVKTEAYENVLRRSGLGNIIVMEVGRSKFDICRLKNSVEIDEARTKAKLLGPMAYGIICTATGFAIRVKPEDKVKAEKLMDPEYAELLGDTMMTLPPGDGLLVEIRGVPRQMDDMTLVRQLSASAHGWKCKPLRLIKTDTPGRKTVLAVTDAMPTETFTKVKMASEIVMVSVHRHAQRNTALWDKIGRKTDDADDFDVTPQKPKTWGPP